MSGSGSAVRKVGVEEELLLVDPESRELAGGQSAVLHTHRTEHEGHSADDGPSDLEGELLRHMVETHTDPATDLDEVDRQLRGARRTALTAADDAGLALAAVATPPLGSLDSGVGAHPRYQRIVNEFGDVGRRAGTMGMHVHVDIADDEEGVRVIDGLRPWLPLLTALSANSPYAGGRDTGYESWRHQVWTRWPSAGTAEPYGSVATYRRVSSDLIRLGAALDPGMLYYDARLSETYPTVEIRVADVCTAIDDALLVVAFTRALVETLAVEEITEPVRSDVLRAAGWRASRYGVSGDLVHPVTWELVPAADALRALAEHVAPALDAAGDTDRVADGLARLSATGNGARRQHAARERSDDLRGVVDDLVTRTADSVR